MKSPVSLRLVVSLLFIIILTPAFARRPVKHTKPTPTPHHETVISSVTPTSLVVTEDKTSRTYAVSQFTEVTLNGQKVTMNDLKPGMAVSVTMADPTHASRITATSSK